MFIGTTKIFAPEILQNTTPEELWANACIYELKIFIPTKAPKVLPHQTIPEVIFEISSKRMGAAAVINEAKELLGIITDGDLRRMLEKNTDFNTLSACDIMTKTPKTISPQDMAVAAFELMEQNSITQLAVVDKGIYKGMLHLHDLLKEGIV